MGAGAFVCGEETALIHSIEGRRGMPRPRPPFPAVRGLFGKPTVINNVETLANVPGIVHHGDAWFSRIGTASSKGTKVFALSGKVARTGLVEVAMGTALRQHRVRHRRRDPRRQARTRRCRSAGRRAAASPRRTSTSTSTTSR